MNVLSINIRGVGDVLKAEWIRGLKTSYGIHFIAIQETKLGNSAFFNANRFWGRSLFDYDMVDAVGQSGGILSVWDPSFFVKTGVLKNHRFLVINEVIKSTNASLTIINVYAPNDVVERKRLWLELLSVRRMVSGLCMLVGDFNEVREPSERRNSYFNRVNAQAFNEFIEEAGLVKYQMGGGKFTYISHRGDKFSKLDRILVCKDYMNFWPFASLTALTKELSDHRPLLLASVSVNFGHIPFRFFNTWLDIPGFVEFVESQCSSFRFVGPADLVLVTKLRWLKFRIKDWVGYWRRQKEGEYNSKKAEINSIENVAQFRPLSISELECRTACLKFVKEFEAIKARDVKQKARVRWAIEGDENSAYFHGILNANLSSSRLHGIKVDGDWIANPTLLKDRAYDFFANKFKEPQPSRPGLVCSGIRKLSGLEASSLIKPFSVTEN
ncbi:uncharacterized protein LOC143543106 [Bidens hawaiensis]|uniref:uncharacterized protein LOC143543106 n=1 Tax=Bidens hawaiensis TaxID=980011 RepID=UPI00404A69EC